MTYILYYWPFIQGRGEFIRLALEDAGIAYRDIAREDTEGGGVEAVADVLDGDFPALAPPVLRAGELCIAQTANILRFLGDHHDLAPADEAGRYWAAQLQLTVTDWVVEIHDTHHPLGPTLHYEEQEAEAARRAAVFRESRLPKFMDYFETVLERNPEADDCLVRGATSHPDLSVFQVLEGLYYAFPRTMQSLGGAYPRLEGLRERVAARPRIAAYLESDRRLPFSEQGIFRHYPELD